MADTPSPAASTAQKQKKTGSPTDFLKEAISYTRSTSLGVIGKQVNVRLNSGIDYRGTLSCLDGYMNIALEETCEYVDGAIKNRYGDAFIRGNNVMYITALE
ncbi:U4/U6-U5 snRNP complex subunit lsm6 [Thecaphora frezii]